MKKFKVVTAFSLLGRYLLIEEDIVYAEPVREMMLVYSVKTRKLLGKVGIDKFNAHVTHGS